MTPRDRGLLALGDQVVADERDQHEDAEQAVDHRRHAGQVAHHRLQDAPDPGRGELDQEDGDEERRDQAEGAPSRRRSGSSTRSAARRGRCRRSRLPIRPDCEITFSRSLTLPPGVNQERPLWANDGHPVHHHGERHPGRAAAPTMASKPARRASARRAGPTTVGPYWVAAALRREGADEVDVGVTRRPAACSRAGPASSPGEPVIESPSGMIRTGSAAAADGGSGRTGRAWRRSAPRRGRTTAPGAARVVGIRFSS